MADTTTESTRPTRYHLATELVYIDGDAVNDNYNAASVPIYQTATFKQENADGSGGEYDYTRSGNPTRTAVEAHMAKIMKAQRAFVVSTGMTALDVILRLVKSGQEIIAGDDLYGGTNRLLTYVSQFNGVKVHNVDTTSVAKVEARLDPIKTRIVLIESPTNPLIKIADIRAIAAKMHATCPNALLVVDNTMMSPYLQNTLDLGADIEYHSGTKYLSGHHDLMAGVIGCKEAHVSEQVYYVINASGSGLGPFDCWLLLRGVKTLGIRMEKQQSNAVLIAAFLEAQGFKVHYPGLKSNPQYELHKSMSSGPGAVLSFETGDVAMSERIVESTRLWGISVSFGCVNSIISMPCKMSHASIPAEVRKQRRLPEDLIRLCVGIEHPDDLINDLTSALTKAGVEVKSVEASSS
ncbi:cystathionine beta-lyase [Coemansia sp. RSA 1813]|nr:cystathionine beta-lyase [Coemansia sp. RSA 1646]KAJ1767132.1 cystathionine beta-lyase [Coemansia sp. RSA 1843]KAJ2085968.1 cystathionine beta-lyase [Coemansia sp. RSA 986]KAJ2210757.1 cystathionine beta-lyase [Coemansia sp. RSA 487]KAJ2563587.1 cystathionine beta-lyase [Coemansia sp. RSA 1813]